MTCEELREKDGQYVVQSYGRNPIAIDHGQGATLYGVDGREYIDFASGIGVLSVGTANPEWSAAVAAQAGRLAHVSKSVLFGTVYPAGGEAVYPLRHGGGVLCQLRGGGQ